MYSWGSLFPEFLRPGLQRDSTARDSAERLLHRRFGRRQFLLDQHFARLVEHAVVAESIAQIHADSQFLRADISLPRHGHSAIVFHKPVSFPCALSASTLGAYRIPSETGLLIPSDKREGIDVCRGRVLRRRAIASRSDCEKVDRSVVFGRCCRNRLLVFSFEPRCKGSADHRSRPGDPTMTR
jgi:hypothetical protein